MAKAASQGNEVLPVDCQLGQESGYHHAVKYWQDTVHRCHRIMQDKRGRYAAERAVAEVHGQVIIMLTCSLHSVTSL